MKKKTKSTKPAPAKCGVREAGVGMECILPPGHSGTHKNNRTTFADPPPPRAKKPKPSKAMDTDSSLMSAHRRKQAEARADKAARAKPRPPTASKFCDEREDPRSSASRVCTLRPGHDGDHDSGVKKWTRAIAKEPSLTDACPKCGHELGEHNGKKCPPKSENRKPLTLEDEPQDDEADAAAIAAMEEEDDQAARWHCEEPFLGDDGQHRKCEGRNEHSGPHYAYSEALKRTVHANPRPEDEEDEDDPEEYETRTDDDRELARQQREAREAHERDIEAGEPDRSLLVERRVRPAEERMLPAVGEVIVCRGKSYPVHPAARLFLTPEDQYRKIVDSIRTEGQLHDVERIDDEANGNPIIDGCSRLRACEELGVDPRVVFVEVDNPYKYVIAANLARRHLTASQRAMAAAELATMGHGANQHTRTGKSAAPPTQAEAAEMTGVSERLVRDAVRVKNQAVDEVKAAIGAGKLRVDAAAHLATLAPSEQRKVLDKATKGKGEVKSGKIRALVKQEEKRAVVAKINKEQVRPVPIGPFRLIVADYPWPYENSDQHDGSRGHITYPPMPLDDICRHAREEIARVAHDNCILGLWVTNHFVHVIGSVIEAAGFTHRTVITWDKMHAGVGTWPRGQTEHLVLASRGTPVHTLNEITTLYREAPRPEHSRKPDGLMDLLAKHCPGPHLELFAREQRKNWASWGAEVDKFKGAA